MLKKLIKAVFTVISIFLILFGLISYFIISIKKIEITTVESEITTSSTNQDNHEPSNIKAPSNPKVLISFAIFIIGFGLLFALYHKFIVSIFKEVKNRNTSEVYLKESENIQE